jgi:hypothetical protein
MSIGAPIFITVAIVLLLCYIIQRKKQFSNSDQVLSKNNQFVS